MAQLLTELKEQIEATSHQQTMLNKCLEKIHNAFESTHSLRGKMIFKLQEENILLREQLTQFQDCHMEFLAERRRLTLESYRISYEAAQAIKKKSKISCNCISSVNSEEDVDKLG